MKRKPLVSFVLVLVMLISLIPAASFATDSPRGDDDYLTFTATGGAVTIKLQKNGSAPTINLEYQTKSDGESWPTEWEPCTDINGENGKTSTIAALAPGHSLRLRACTTTAANVAMAKDDSNYWKFEMTEMTSKNNGKVKASGDITSLLDGANKVFELNEYAFCRLFESCGLLISSPALPATTLAQSCYHTMFFGCKSLETAPALPATTLAQSCYSSMFSGCTSLTAVSALPATTLAQSCYSNMFSGCTSLVTAPALSATIMAEDACNAMFSGCTSLTVAPDLLAEQLQQQCYKEMFKGCTSLVTAPALLATIMAEDACNAMFSSCTSLTVAPDLLAEQLQQQCYKEMFIGCTSLVTAPALSATIMAKDACNAMFSSCTSLTVAPDLLAEQLQQQCYKEMFKGCTSLVTAPALPATTLVQYCYSNMFSGCTGLTTAPELPATTLKSNCYNSMFKGCTRLTTAPALHATTLAQSCYSNMFSGCTSLVTAPALPAEQLQQQCYMEMFSGCTSLQAAPTLPATTLEGACYWNMFNGCTRLVTAPELPAETLTAGCYYNMFGGCTSLTSAPALPAERLAKQCYQQMFDGCTSLSSILVGFADWESTPGSIATTNWMNGVTSPFAFYCSPELDTTEDASHVPSGSEVVKITLSALDIELSTGETTPVSVTVSPASIPAAYKETIKNYLKLQVSNDTVTTDGSAETGFTVKGEIPGTAIITASSFSTTTTFTAVVSGEAVTPPAPAPSYSGGGSASYPVSVSADIKNGKLTVDKKNASAGETVTITVAPDKGLTLETITILDKNGKEVEVKNLGNNKFSFKMPSGKVTISATFMEDNSMLNFCVDVKASDYYYDAVLWAYENGICAGTDVVHFSPKAPVTRAQVVTFLWRAAGCPVVNYAMNMKDVKADGYYAEAVRWALSEGITVGTTDTTFAPNQICNREQIVTFLYRYAKAPAILNMTANGPAPSPFSDVPNTAYSYNAVMWASKNGITEGTTETTFSPKDECQRGQTVTFLYRYFVK